MTPKEMCDKAIDLARAQSRNKVEMRSSALLCLADAVDLRAYEDYHYSIGKACDSLAYSVGFFHEDHKACAKMYKETM